MILGLTDFRDKNRKEKRNLGQVKMHIWFSQEKPNSGKKQKGQRPPERELEMFHHFQYLVSD